jgi:hypothetical protein
MWECFPTMEDYAAVKSNRADVHIVT